MLKHEPLLINRYMFAAGNANGVARLTAIIVNLGLEKLAAGIVINLTDQGKADIVAQVGPQLCSGWLAVKLALCVV